MGFWKHEFYLVYLTKDKNFSSLLLKRNALFKIISIQQRSEYIVWVKLRKC